MKNIILVLCLLATCLCNAQTIDLIKDLNAGPANCASIAQYAVLNNELYFVYGGGLWKTDGTPAGTLMLKQLDIKSEFVAGNGLLFFMADENGKRMLWKTDGTSAGTVAIGSGYSINQYTNELIFFNGNVFFNGYDAVHGGELWRSDGTDAGTYMVKDLDAYMNLSSDSPGPAGFFITNNKFYFSQNDSTASFLSSQDKLWETNGITISKVANIFTYGDVIIANNKIYSISDSNYKDTLPSAGLYEIDLATGAYSLIYADVDDIYDPVRIGNKVLFIRGYESEYNLYTLDTTNAHLEKVSDTLFIFKSYYGKSANSRTFKFFASLNNKFFLLKEGDNIGAIEELWQTDGTTAGTRKVSLPGEIRHVNDIAAVGNILFLKAYDTISKRVDIWYMDGQAHFYRIPPSLPNPPMYDIYPQPFLLSMLSDPLYVYNNSLVFTNSYDSAIGKELYKIDVSALSVEEPMFHHAVIYPNPAMDFISIQNASVEQVSIIDNLGKIILTTSGQKINVQHLAPGIYFMDIRLKNGERQFAKFVKE